MAAADAVGDDMDVDLSVVVAEDALGFGIGYNVYGQIWADIE